MKLKSCFLALVFSLLSFSATAQSIAHVEWFLHPTVAVARVVNVWGWPVHCQGRVFGVTASGMPSVAWFNDIIPAGQFREAVVHTIPYNPFIDGRSDILCF